MSRLRISVRYADAADSDAIEDLFERAGCPCYCQYHQFPGDHRQWQVTCANDRAANRRALRQQLQDGCVNALVAIYESTGQDRQVVGWARFERPEQLPKIYQGRLYKGLPCFTGDRSEVWTLACFLVDPNWRRQGVAAQLLAGIKAQAGRRGARFIEAFPRGASDVSDGEQWLGPRFLLEREGFEVVHDFAPYPVLRAKVAPSD